MTITSTMDDGAFSDDEALIAAVRNGDSTTAVVDPLVLQLRTLRDALVQAPSPEVQWNHVAAMRRAARPTRGVTRVRGLVVVAAAAVGVVGTTMGLAAADRLPAVVQDPVARIAGVVGIDVPHSDDTPDVHPASKPSEPPRGTDPTGRNGGVPAAGADAAVPGAEEHGKSADAPGRNGTAPGLVDPPGNRGGTPGHDDASPGNSANAPGHNKAADEPATGLPAPGNSGNSPGQKKSDDGEPSTGLPPGNSGNAPGHNKAADGTPSSTPSATAPGQLKKQAGGNS